MKKILFLFFIVFSIAGIAQTNDGPIITFDSTVINYGTVPQGSEPFRKLSFTNTGNKPLIIDTCLTTCSCYSATCPSQKQFLPGEKGEIVAKYDTQRLGANSKTITIKSNATNGNVYINLKVVVVPKESISPEHK